MKNKGGKEHIAELTTEKNVVVFPEQKSVQTQASEWIARLEVSEPTPAVLEEFRIWVNEDVQHRSEFERLSGLWGDLNILTQLTLPASRKHRPTPGEKVIQWFTSGYVRAGAALACLVLLVVTLFFQGQQGQREFYQTAIGEQKTIALPDNSIVHLNTGSRIRLDFSEARRGIYLEQGEAHFNVHKDRSRPFEVYAGTGLVRAIGTAFNVRLYPDNVEVIVSEGVVEITPINNHPAATGPVAEVVQSEEKPVIAQVVAGEQASYRLSKPEHVEHAPTEEVVRKLTWREGILEFKREPLANVVAEVGRYIDTRIVIVDENARQQRVGGRFKVGETKILLEVLSSGFGINVVRREKNTIYLSYGDAIGDDLDLDKNAQF